MRLRFVLEIEEPDDLDESESYRDVDTDLILQDLIRQIWYENGYNLKLDRMKAYDI